MLEKAISDMGDYQCIGELHYYGDIDGYVEQAPKKPARPQSALHKNTKKPANSRNTASLIKAVRPLAQKRVIGGYDDDIRMGKDKDRKQKPPASFSGLSKAVTAKFTAQNKIAPSQRKKTGSRKPVERTVSIRVDYGSTGGGK